MGDARSDRENRDRTQLNVLSIFHNLVAALWAVVALFPVAYLGTGMQIIQRRFDDIPELTETFGWTVVLWSTVSVVLSVAMAMLTYVAGWRLVERRARSFCLLVAAINCFFVPLGTVLGVLTIIVLKRPEVRKTFRTERPLPNVAAWEDTKLP